MRRAREVARRMRGTARRVREAASRARVVVRRAGAVVGLVLAAACIGEGGSSGDGVTREEFIEAYVALRAAGLQSATGVISSEDRERILAAEDVTQEELLEFAVTHGGNSAFMREVWDEVESRLHDRRTGSDSVR